MARFRVRSAIRSCLHLCLHLRANAAEECFQSRPVHLRKFHTHQANAPSPGGHAHYPSHRRQPRSSQDLHVLFQQIARLRRANGEEPEPAFAALLPTLAG